MKSVYFHNASVLPIECIKTFGISVKENENPIGYFGTGLKYAIAVLLREGCGVELVIENEVFNFSKVKQAIRGQDFDLVYMNGDLLPFSTDLGKNWKLWQAYRELYSNCMDELGAVGCEEPPIGGTCIEVTGLEEIHEDRGQFILSSSPKYVLDKLEIHESETPGIFYRGIRVLDLPTKYSYNILSEMTLTEDRTASQWEVNYSLTKVLTQSTNIDAVTDILSITDEDFYEATMNWSQSVTPSEGFMHLVSQLKQKSHTLDSFYSHHYPTFIGKLDRAVLSSSAQRTLDSLKKIHSFHPVSVLFASMNDDYKINDQEIVLNIDLLTNKPKLRFCYVIACTRIQSKDKVRHLDDYQLICGHLLHLFKLDNKNKAKSKIKKTA